MSQEGYGALSAINLRRTLIIKLLLSKNEIKKPASQEYLPNDSPPIQDIFSKTQEVIDLNFSAVIQNNKSGEGAEYLVLD
jgi:hypothetical protein